MQISTFVQVRASRAFLLSLIAAGTLTTAACKKPEGSAAAEQAQPDDAPPIKVQTVTAIETMVPEYLVLTGDLSANEQSEVAADATGKVISTKVERGQMVKRGDILATLDTRAANLNQQALAAQSGLSQSQLALAQTECDRGQHLYDTGAISKADYDRTMSTCQTTKFSVAAANANQALAQKTLGDAIIRAPFSGAIGERYVNVGQYVQPQTRVASVYEVDPLRLSLTVPESEVARVQQGMTVGFNVTAFPDTTFNGTVKYISPNVRVSSRDLVVEAVVPNADGKLRPGMFATVRLALRSRPLPTVPAAAVKSDESTQRVFVVGADGRADERIVAIADASDPTLGARIGILNGLKVGEVVIVNPSSDLKDGVKVSATAAPADAVAPAPSGAGVQTISPDAGK